MRSSDGYIKTLAYLKHRFVPGFFAILFVVAGAMILNHVAFLLTCAVRESARCRRVPRRHR
jgi:hypothetical protein